MLETEFLFFQGMKKRIDQRISEGNYDEAAVSMQKCMEYILNSLDGRNNDYQKVCVLFEVQARVMENHPQYPFYWHEWETVIKYCDQQMHLQGKPIDLEQLKSDTVIAHQMFEKIVQDYLNHGDSVISNKLNNERELPLPCGTVVPMEVASNSRDSYPFLTKRLAVRTNQGIFTYAAIPLTGIPFGFSLWNPYTSGAERNV